jgi:glycosyltransferase involved in cell wall biosynthesis
MNKVKFSICIPAFKSTYLNECIKSVLNQTVNDFELIVLNDCSPEPIEEIVMKNTDLRIRYYKNEKNVGAYNLTDNWDKCLELSNGECIVMMGDDDRLTPNYLAEFSNLIENYPELAVYHCRSKIIDDDGCVMTLTPSLPSYERVYDSIWHRLRQLRFNYISDYVYRRSELIAQGGFFKLPLAWGSDDITAFIASAEKGIAHTNLPVFEYRSNRLSITSTGIDIHKMTVNNTYGEWLDNFLKDHPPHPSEEVIYQDLLRSKAKFILQKKQYTMLTSMRGNPLRNASIWIKNKDKFGLSIRDIAICLLKSLKKIFEDRSEPNKNTFEFLRKSEK